MPSLENVPYSRGNGEPEGVLHERLARVACTNALSVPNSMIFLYLNTLRRLATPEVRNIRESGLVHCFFDSK